MSPAAIRMAFVACPTTLVGSRVARNSELSSYRLAHHDFPLLFPLRLEELRRPSRRLGGPLALRLRRSKTSRERRSPRWSSDAAPAPASADPAPEASAPEAAAPPAASAAPAAAAPPVGVLCEKMCDAQAPKCSAEQVKECRHNYCSRYSGAPDVCEPSARAALECAQSQPDSLLCSNVVPSICAKKFFAIEKCLSTGVAPPPDQEGPKLPDGWSRYEANDAAFSVLMPKGVETKAEAGVKSWTAKAGDATYSITLQPPPPEKKFDQKAFLRIATKLLGRCGDKMKLFAIVEKPDRSMIQYKRCVPTSHKNAGCSTCRGRTTSSFAHAGTTLRIRTPTRSRTVSFGKSSWGTHRKKMIEKNASENLDLFVLAKDRQEL